MYPGNDACGGGFNLYILTRLFNVHTIIQCTYHNINSYHTPVILSLQKTEIVLYSITEFGNSRFERLGMARYRALKKGKRRYHALIIYNQDRFNGG